jgi:cytochrome oxidase Cu insertion factor (SCO1/SenC/PrrC family)
MKRLLISTALITAALLPAAQIPRPALPLSFVASNGQKINLTDYKGKVLVLEILSTTCPHCQTSAQILSKLRTEFAPKGFEVLGYAINPDADVANFARQYANFPVGRGQRDKAYEFLQISLMQQFYFPQMVFIDRSGMIRAQYGGTDAFLTTNEEANIRGMIEKLLGERSAPAKKTSPRAKKKAS